jgi:WD40 repeat protein
VLKGHVTERAAVVFAPDGSWLASASADTTIRLWPLSSKGGLRGRVLFSTKGQGAEFYSLAVTPDGQSLVAGTAGGETWLVPIDGDGPRLVGRSNDVVQAIAVSPNGRTIATGSGYNNPEEGIIRLWDLDTGVQRRLDPGDKRGVSDLEFMRDGRLLSASGGILRRWNLEDGSNEVLKEGGVRMFDVSADGNGVLSRSGGTWGIGAVRYLSLVEGESHDLPGFGTEVSVVALDPTGSTAVTEGERGVVQVGMATGGDPHLLFGHQTAPWGIAVSPDGRWIASAGSEDGVIRLWPMPDLSKPPLHTLPREELIAKLKTLTNLRAVRDEESPTGWKVDVGPFPGWETVPEW